MKIDDLLNDYLYDRESGFLMRTVRFGKKVQPYRSFNSKNNAGYYSVTVSGRRVGLHIATWAYHNGRWPADEVDHIDRNKDNYRIENLRESTSAQNKQNTKVNKLNTSGKRNVCFHKPSGRWRSVYVLNSVRSEKYHNTKEDAENYVSSFVELKTERSALLGKDNARQYGIRPENSSGH